MENDSNTMTNHDPALGVAGFLITCALYVVSASIVSSLLQNMAWVATFATGVVNIYYLVKNNNKRKRK